MNLLKKLTSRKFFFAFIGAAVGVYVAAGGDGNEVIDLVKTVAGLLTTAGFGITYINAEAKVDAAAAREARK